MRKYQLSFNGFIVLIPTTASKLLIICRTCRNRGIGYYSLPALIHGKARHVYSCEWNPHAASFLRYNLEQNGVSDRATVLDGDSRIRLAEEGVLNLDFDRVSLGLLPSSEGGWKTALSALNREKGGWLHIHANVPSHERDKWALWMCRKLSTIYLEIYPDDSRSRAWIVCHNVEKVKSYSPKVDHFVADVFVGPRLPEWMRLDLDEGQGRVGICSNKGFLESDVFVEPPSCALGNGVLDQEWMM
jgi:tRNA wybutosine-synthesizing protein 2